MERELVLRLASLLWRLRRTTSIETGLMQIEGQILRGQQQTRQKTPEDGALTALFRLRKRPTDGQSDEDRQEAAATIMHSTILTPTSTRPQPRGRREIKVMSRDISCVSQISIMVCSSGSAAMRWRFGAKSGRRYLRSKECGGGI